MAIFQVTDGDDSFISADAKAAELVLLGVVDTGAALAASDFGLCA
ncbi:hypothetical protein [Derxia gummosa]|uniref:Uncharacterized protein n=1 Tax=Derxia gummosa DSM 723 TaxID=1121388 RepID=A0A9U5CH28_9BURK|nr:hypothetical protein [Derxia gummosa]